MFWNISIFSGDFADFDELVDVYNSLMAALCVACAGVAAGLTVGLLSLDITKLEIKMMTGSDEERAAVERVLPIVKQHHLLLVTLMLFNSLANETLPVFLGALMPNYLAVIVSVSLVLVFGEILPSALFTGPSQLLQAARFSPIVYLLFAVFYPVAFPISRLLDWWFGEDEDSGSISRRELEALVILQGDEHKRLSRQNTTVLGAYANASKNNSNVNRTFNSNSNSNSSNSYYNYNSSFNNNNDEENDNTDTLSVSASSHSHSHTHAHTPGEDNSLSSHEVRLMTGIMRVAKATIQEAMIPVQRVCMISSSTVLDEDSLRDILESGFSRIPVYWRQHKHHIVGYMLVKELIVVDPHDGLTVADLSLREPLCVKPELGLLEMLSIFQQGQCHLALVSLDPVGTLTALRNGDPPKEQALVLGLVTMEDVLERMLQSDILDETDSSCALNHFPHGGAPVMLLHRSQTRTRRSSFSPGAETNANNTSSRVSSTKTNGNNNNKRKKERVLRRGSVVAAAAQHSHTYNNANSVDGAIPSRRLFHASSLAHNAATQQQRHSYGSAEAAESSSDSSLSAKRETQTQQGERGTEGRTPVHKKRSTVTRKKSDEDDDTRTQVDEETALLPV